MDNRTYPRDKHAISIIACTNRRSCMENLFRNYSRQNFRDTELIVILNHKSLKLDEYLQAARPYQNVRIYSLPEHVSLGSCLNYGVSLSRYGLIAKFDDDDYYGPNYLTESRRVLLTTGADIVGKRAHFMYLSGRKVLLLRYGNRADRYAPLVQGATLLIRRHVFSQVGFPDRNRGECVKLCSDSLAKGFTIYSGSPYNFLAIRRKNAKSHTWTANEDDLLRRHPRVGKVKNIRRFVCRG
ncbi:Glycosyl transferase family 2 [Paenibacillus sp. UNCCL117]|uniref:glycosyltransferase family 2 protein n=1 Tax=unclassified Paenibacillus TaxID=185978 RepID=UPI00088C5D96|nr:MULTISPECIES: glycosyltransferase family A protein [unclassified Paenibacillus]SDC96029.1 Glycosyl transferase family 2 [Paenibacillus sp. cl123]SFW30197.1 Glycosyl transferase family 2 [Paenibacillus sp. UNCCL117]